MRLLRSLWAICHGCVSLSRLLALPRQNGMKSASRSFEWCYIPVNLPLSVNCAKLRIKTVRPLLLTADVLNLSHKPLLYCVNRDLALGETRLPNSLRVMSIFRSIALNVNPPTGCSDRLHDAS